MAVQLSRQRLPARLEEGTERSYSILVFQEGVLEWLQHHHHATGTAAILWANFRASFEMFTEWADVCILNRSPSGLLDGMTLGEVTGELALPIKRTWSQVLGLPEAAKDRTLPVLSHNYGSVVSIST
jgi:hypothetical protein